MECNAPFSFYFMQSYMKTPKRKEFERKYKITNIPWRKKIFGNTSVVIRYKQANLYETEEHFEKVWWDIEKLYEWTKFFVKEHTIEWWMSDNMLKTALPYIWEELKNTYLIGCYITKEEYDKQERILNVIKTNSSRKYEQYKNNAILEAANAVALSKTLMLDPISIMERYTIEQIAYIANGSTFISNSWNKDWETKNISWLNKREHENRSEEQKAKDDEALRKLDNQSVDFTSIQGWESWQSKG